MKRRGFLGILGGAAAAGPTVAKEALARLPTGMGDVVLDNVASRGLGGKVDGGRTMVGKGGPNEDWRVQEIAKLRRWIAGDKSAEEMEDERRRRLDRRQYLISQNVASLVSVSPVQKLGIYNDRVMTHCEELEIMRHKSNLQRMVSEMMR